MEFEWDEKKATTNERKHGIGKIVNLFVSFPDHSESEHRFLTFGMSLSNRYLVVCHTDRGAHIRIINARLMTRNERKIYEEG